MLFVLTSLRSCNEAFPPTAFVKIQLHFSRDFTTNFSASEAVERIVELFGLCLSPTKLFAGDGDGSSGVVAAGESRGGEGNHGEIVPKGLGNNMGVCL